MTKSNGLRLDCTVRGHTYVMSNTALVRRRSDFSRERARSIDNCMDYKRARSNPTFVSKRFEFQSLSILGAKGLCNFIVPQ